MQMHNSKEYFVQTINSDGYTNRWEFLNQAQANAIYAEQVELYGRIQTTTGEM
jgi:hypothetical protein